MSECECSSTGGQWGCLSIIVTVVILWALLFGVTWNGVHYGISCSTDKGVEVMP